MPTRAFKLFSALAFCFSSAAWAMDYYVVPGGSGTKDGTSWTNALGDVQAAIDACEVSGGGTVKIAAGTYKPTTQPNIVPSGVPAPSPAPPAIYNHFSLRNNVKVWGGYKQSPESRDPQLYPTILSGDIGGNDQDSDGDGLMDADLGDNCRVFYHPPWASVDSTAQLDGVTISGGSGRENLYYFGGGGPHGGGMFNAIGISPKIRNCVFRDNISTAEGGAFYKEWTYTNPATPILDRCTFLANQALRGGAVGFLSVGNARVENCTFVANSASTEGGAVFSSGSSGGSALAFRNCTLVNNRAETLGGGVFAYATVTNCILWGNSGNTTSNPQLASALVVSFSIVQGGCEGAGNLNKDPLLLPLNNYGGFTPAMALRGDSPAISAGSPDAPATDQRGYLRTLGYDIGAYEYRLNKVIYVKAGGTGDGSSWANASGNLTVAISGATPPADKITEIWVAEGTYTGTIALRSYVSIYGGFSGSETQLSERDISAHPTVLSADLNGDDTDTDGDGVPDAGTSENANDVCSSHAVYPSAMLDGFILSGAATAAIRNFYGPPTSLNAPTIVNCTFRHNLGGSVLNESYAAPKILNCTFHHNGTTSPVMTNSVNSSPVVVNCTFINGSSSDSMPVIRNETQSLAPKFLNCTFSVGAYQTAISNASGTSPTIRNCIIWGNSNTSGIQGGSPIVSNCVMQGGFNGGKDVSAQNPLLMPLRNYGGAMLTMPVSAGSPAISQGLAGGADAPYADQRGFTRDSQPDIGACEWQSNLLVIQTPDGETRYPQASRAVLEVVSESFDLTGAGWQWFLGQVGDTSNPIDGATSSRYVTPPLDETADYWVLRTPDGLSAGISLDVFTPSVVFVKPGGNDGADGSSWAQAKQSVKAALQAALPGQDIWVAAGTYRISGDPLALRNNVRLMGGFAGMESSLTKRNIAANPAILSADSSGNDADSDGDGIPDSNLGDNVLFIFGNSGVGRTAVLDGFVLSGASQQAILNTNSSPTITNCVFTKNSGSMIENQSSSPTVDSCAFYQNGGRIRNSYGYPTFKNCSFWDNSFNQFGYPPNAMVTDDWNSASSIINCTVLSEPGQPSLVSDSGKMVVSNCILWGNGDSAPAIAGFADVSNCVIQGGHSGGANVITDDPLLLPPGYYAGPTPSMPVSAGSPSINAGVVTASTPTFDQRGFVRDAQPDIGACEWQEKLVVIHSGNDDNRYAIGSTASLSVVSESALPGTTWQWYRGTVGDTSDPIVGATQSRYVTGALTADTSYWVQGWTHDGQIDIGITLSVYAPHVIYVRKTDTGDESSWQRAMPSLQSALAASQPGDQIWVAEGTYRETISLRNGVSVFGGFSGVETRLDQRDIAAYPTILSADTNGNDLDTNGDGVPDSGTTENASSVCLNSGVDSSAVFDGFILSGAKTAAVVNTGGSSDSGSSPTIANCTFRGNLGTSVENWGSSAPDIQNCTFSNNNVYKTVIKNSDSSSPAIVNCTFSAKPAPSPQPSVENTSQSAPKITNCTFVMGWIYNATSGVPTIRNCILWDNAVSTGIMGTPSSVSNSIIQGGFAAGTNIITQDPKLLPLGNYGGATPTMPVSAGSPAINQGQTGADIPYADQRGYVRHPQPNIDIGACEWQQQGVVAIIPEEGTDRYAIGTRGVLGAFCESTVTGTTWQWYRGALGDTISPVSGATLSRYGTPPLTANTSYWVRGTNSGTHLDGGIALAVYAPRVIYVSASGNHGNGSSWQMAMPDLQSALTAAQSGDQIWVAAGTYKSLAGAYTLNGSRVSVYGGFSGVETRLDQRDIAAHPTILSADIIGNDADLDGDGILDPATTTDNAPFIFNSNGRGPAALDGFVLSGATSAAIVNTGNSPTIANCTFRYNLGSCVRNGISSSPTIRNSAFHHNTVGYPVVNNSDHSSPTIVNCSFGANSATGAAPTIYNSTQSSPKITNCTFSTGTTQTAILNNDAASTPTIRNCIIWGSFSVTGIQGGFSSVSNCVMQRNFPGGTSISTKDPLLLPLGNYGGPTPTMPLGSGSSAINTGATGSDSPYADQRGFVRDILPDIGACEFGVAVAALAGDEPAAPGTIGSTPTVTACTDKANPTYQWFYGAKGDTSQPVPRGNSQSLFLGPLEAGVKVWARITPGDGSAAMDTSERTFEVQGTYDQWCDHHGLTGTERDTNATVAGDGVGNLLKFALGLRPRDHNSIGDRSTTRFDNATSKLTQEWRISKTPSGLTIVFEGSNDLKTWSPITPVLTGEDPAFETWKASVDAVLPAKAAYLRARVIKQ